MPNARILPSGSYRCRATWTDKDGNRHSKSFTAKTKKAAERLAADYEVSMASIIDSVTFQESAEQYIASRSNTLSPTTLNEYRAMLRRGFPFQDKSVHEITEIDIQRFINDYAGNHSPKTVRNVHGFITTVIHSVRPDMMIKTRLPQKKIYDATIPEDDDVKKILAVADPELKKAIYMAALGPMRRSEVCGATYEDLKRGTLHVHQVMVKNGNDWILKDIPKTTASDRFITFPPYVVKVLGKGTGRIIQSNPRIIYNKFKKACKEAGTPSFRFHDLRHYGASVLHSLGVPDAYIMERGGWETDETLKNVYRHALTSESKKYNEIANKHFESLA